MANDTYNDNVFVNCPFDLRYKRIFDAIVFTIYDCGFVARCSLEEDAAGEARLAKILDLVSESRYAIHDISRTQLDRKSKLPRFNMPLELGVYLGAQRFGNRTQQLKKFLILDRDQYRYQQYVSDLSGYDIRAHSDDPEVASGHVRDWLVVASRRKLIPGKSTVWSDYLDFRDRLPAYCHSKRLNPKDLLFIEFSYAVADILIEQDEHRKQQVQPKIDGT